MMRWARWCAAVTIASLVGGAQGAGAQGARGAQGSGGTGERGERAASPHTVVTNDMLLQAASGGDWLMYGHNYWNNRFSPLNKLNTANVKNLVPRMVFTHGAERLGSFETTPVVAGGIMYITSPATPNNVVTAYDLRTAKQLWRYE